MCPGKGPQLEHRRRNLFFPCTIRMPFQKQRQHPMETGTAHSLTTETFHIEVCVFREVSYFPHLLDVSIRELTTKEMNELNLNLAVDTGMLTPRIWFFTDRLPMPVPPLPPICKVGNRRFRNTLSMAPKLPTLYEGGGGF